MSGVMTNGQHIFEGPFTAVPLYFAYQNYLIL